MEVEDAVMPLARLLPAHTLLATRDPLLRHLALQAVGGHAPDLVPAITREAIEALFERLVAQSSRHYSHQDPDLPQDPCTAAALLVSCTTGSAPTCGCCRTAWMPPLEHTPVTDLVAAMPHHQVARAARKNFQPKPPPARTTPA